MKAAAPIGCVFTFLCLVTGALWGKPMWGAWWVWDARLTSVLVLLLIYLGIVAIWNAIEDQAYAARVAALATLVGFVNIPIVKFSVEWRNPCIKGLRCSRSKGRRSRRRSYCLSWRWLAPSPVSTSRSTLRRCATRSCAAGCAGSPSSPLPRCLRALPIASVEGGVRA